MEKFVLVIPVLAFFLFLGFVFYFEHLGAMKRLEILKLKAEEEKKANVSKN